MAQLQFDASAVQPDTGTPDAIPAGYYNVMVDDSDVKPTAAGDGAYLQVRYNVLDGQYAGRKLFDRFNVQNPNPVAQEIGYKQLSALAHAVNVLHIQDSAQLHGIPLQVKVKIRAAKGDYEASNEITGRYPAGTNAVGSTQSVPGQSPFPVPAQNNQAAPGGWGGQAAPVTQQAPGGWAQPQTQTQPQGFQTQPQTQPVQQQPPAQPWAQQPQGQQPQSGQGGWGQPAVAQSAPAQSTPAQPWAQQPDPSQQQQQAWANGVAQQAPAEQAQAQQVQHSAPITQQPAVAQLQPGQSPQSATPPWVQ